MSRDEDMTRELGWYRHKGMKYRLWDGQAWVLRFDWTELERLRGSGAVIAGHEVDAPLCDDPPSSLERAVRSAARTVNKWTDKPRSTSGQDPEPGLRPLDGGGWACPKCNGTQFKLRRTAGQRGRVAAGWVTTGVGAVTAARKHQQKVQCVTCGTFYDRISDPK